MSLPKKTPFIYLITEGKITNENYPESSQQLINLIQIAVESEVTLIQLREKLLSARKVFELAVQIANITKNSQTRLLINDRADIALAAKADGVHLTGKSLFPRIIRQNFPPNFIIGCSAHSIEGVLSDKETGADFATFSSIFATPSKIEYGAPQGLNKLREVCIKAENYPIIALGGIEQTNFRSALNAGAKGVAAIRLFNNPGTLPQIVDKIRNG
jgi:thiamine-phosphate pyrophosphorylase